MLLHNARIGAARARAPPDATRTLDRRIGAHSMAADVVAKDVDGWKKVCPFSTEEVGRIAAHPHAVHSIRDLSCVPHTESRRPFTTAARFAHNRVRVVWVAAYIPRLLDFAAAKRPHLRRARARVSLLGCHRARIDFALRRRRPPSNRREILVPRDILVSCAVLRAGELSNRREIPSNAPVHGRVAWRGVRIRISKGGAPMWARAARRRAGSRLTC